MSEIRRRRLVVAIDGPAGSGKSTVASKLAKRLGFIHLNSGALFRTVGMLALERGLPLNDDSALADLARGVKFSFELTNSGDTKFFADGEDVSSKIFTDEAGAAASKIGILAGLREVLAGVQREAAKTHPLVLEGRDAGSVIFPDAEAKFFLQADLDIRAERRFKQLAALPSFGSPRNPGWEKEAFDAVKAEIAERDHRDQTRAIAPQVITEDAVVLDTSGITADEVVAIVSERIDKLLGCEKESQPN